MAQTRNPPTHRTVLSRPPVAGCFQWWANLTRLHFQEHLFPRLGLSMKRTLDPKNGDKFIRTLFVGVCYALLDSLKS